MEKEDALSNNTSEISVVWATRVEIADPAPMLERVRATKYKMDDIIAFVEVGKEALSAIVICPTGTIYRLDAPDHDPKWWSFAARNYYIVTGNLADRNQMAALCEIEPALITGDAISRTKETSLSRLSLDALFDKACPPLAIQASLF